MPLLRKGGLAVGKEVAKGAYGVLEDVAEDVNISAALRDHGRTAINNLKRKAIEKLENLEGSGYKRVVKKRKIRQSTSKRVKKKRVKKPLKKKPVIKKKKSTKPKKNLAAKRYDYFSG